jgi:hypothetical protein
VALSSARARLGLDLGNDAPTFGVGQQLVVEPIRNEFPVDVRANVHGLDIYSESCLFLFLMPI